MKAPAMPELSFDHRFAPAWWCRGAHLQTIFAKFFRPVPRIKLDRRRLETPDGDFLDVDVLGGRPEAPQVIILHGLEGSSRAPYVLSLLGKIRNKGWRAAALNFRGCGGEANRLKLTYHSGKTEDLDFLVRALKCGESGGETYLVGYSIGGNLALKWLGEQEGAAARKIRKAAVVSVPCDLAKAAELMDRGFNREVYTRRLLATLKVKALTKEKQFPGSLNAATVRRSRTFREFDREVTARLNGFKDENDYWMRCSSRYYLSGIRVETLLIHAEDDPFFQGPFMPLDEIEKSDFLKIMMPTTGGHVGFVSGPWPWKQDLWLEKTILDFFEAEPNVNKIPSGR